MIRLFCLLLAFLFVSVPAEAAERTYRHIVVLGDPHFPGQYMEAKEQVLRTVNSWPDVDLVVAAGDLCEDRGTVEEYRTVKRFFGGLAKPFLPVPGNHDVVYRDELNANGRRVRGDDATREEKRRRFREAFSLRADYHSRKEGGYLLVFLSPERPEHLAEMSYRQVDWLRSELKKHRRLPTIVFFHAPLRGTLPDYNFRVNTPNYIAQPADRIHDVLMENPQVFLWVSGHTHTVPTHEGFASAVNVYERRVTNIHNPDMNRAGIWTNSLYLFPDRVVVRTYDHGKGAWLPELERIIRPEDPRKAAGRSRAGVPP
ncbi:MAG: hypothetical protein HPY65_02935 [Syntrophaceae bacterium]|nr:hypothetical protein [Syntrophaceae bacterium]